MKRIIAIAGALLIAAALPAIALGTVTGGCTVTGTSPSGGSIDLTSASEWHLRSTDTAGGSGTAPSQQTSASVGAYALGLTIPIASGSGSGGTSGSVDGLSMSTFALLGARFEVTGSSAGPGGGCSGDVLIIIDDVNPLFTLLGGGGLVVAALGAIVLLLAMRSGGGAASRFFGLVMGALGGAGLGVGLAQLDVLDPSSFLGLAFVVGGALLGLLLPGLLNRGSGAVRG